MWEKIKDCDYEASIDGKIRSIAKVIIRKNGKPYTVISKILSTASDKCGYQRVGLIINGKLTTRKVHRLVAQCFIAKIDEYDEVNHINGIKNDNRSVNLEWTNRSLNQLHAFKNKLQIPMRGESNPTSTISEIQAIEIKRRLAKGDGPLKISRDMRISKNITKDISRKKTWKHV